MTVRNIKATNFFGKEEEIGIIIPAAGLGKRMKSRGPKPLIKITENITILQNQIKNIQDSFVNHKVVLVCGFEADKLMNAAPSSLVKVENEFYEDTNVARSIGIALRVISAVERVLIIYGDLVFDQRALEVLDYNTSAIFALGKFIGEEEVGCVINDKGNLEHMMYDLPHKWAQISYFQGKELSYLKEVVWNRNNNKLFGFEIINQVIEKGGQFRCDYIEDIKIVDVDTSKDIQKAREII
jgi:choline kinase